MVGALAYKVEPRFGKCFWYSQSPSHISKMVRPTVKIGPLAGDRTRASSRGGIVDGAASQPASNGCSQVHCPRVPEFFVAIASYE